MYGSEWSATWGEGGRVREGFMEAVIAMEEGKYAPGGGVILPPFLFKGLSHSPDCRLLRIASVPGASLCPRDQAVHTVGAWGRENRCLSVFGYSRGSIGFLWKVAGLSGSEVSQMWGPVQHQPLLWVMRPLTEDS